MEEVETIRELVQPLYDNGDLLGFSLYNDEGALEHNESFLSDEMAIKSAGLFIETRLKILKSARRLMRMTVELDDVILMYCRLDEGHVIFTFDADSDIDFAAKAIVPT